VQVPYPTALEIFVRRWRIVGGHLVSQPFETELTQQGNGNRHHSTAVRYFLDPTKRYDISVLPGGAANGFENGSIAACSSSTDLTCGHGPSRSFEARRKV